MSKIHGMATIKIDGQHIETKDDATLTVGGPKNTSRTIGRNTHYVQTHIGSKLECTIAFDASKSLTELQGMAGVQIQFHSDTGLTYIIRNAAQTGEISISGGDSGGEVALVFEGEAAEEMR